MDVGNFLSGHTGRLTFLVCCFLLLGLAVSDGAYAHTDLVETSPASGAEVEGSVAEIRLTFTEPVDPGLEPVEVYDANGERVRVGDATVAPDDPNSIVVPTDDLGAGGYGVIWRVTSIDGHVVEGDYLFSVVAKPEPPREDTGTDESNVETTQVTPEETSAPEETTRQETIVADNASSGDDGTSGGSGNTGLYAAVIVFAVVIIGLGVAGASRFRNRES